MRRISREACVRIAVALALLGQGSIAGASEPAAPPPTAAPAAPASNVEGLWQGTLIYKKAELEADVLVELARDAKGKWVGTIDVPNQQMKFHPLDNIRIDGSAVYFEFNRFAQKAQVMVETPFTGTVAADGETISGDFYEGKANHVPLVLKRIGGAGSERPEPHLAEVHPLAPDGAELRALFNRDAGKVRLVLLLSPTCGICAISARVVQTYVLDTIPGDRLRVYMVWGPMLGEEKESDVKPATAHLPDSRVTHFWTPVHTLAQAMAGPAGLKDEKAWDTFQVYAADAHWGETPPVPAYVMHVGKSLPPERRLNGETLAQKVRELLAAP